MFVVEILDDVFSLFPCDLMVHFLVESLVDFSCTFVRDFSFNVHFEEVGDCGLKFCLDEPELLIDLVPENFSEHTNIIILP